MGRIVVTEFITVDGVIEDPGGSEKTARGGWAFKFDRGPAGDKFKMDETMGADGMLLGRITYEGFAEAWPTRTGEFADRMNHMPKYVVSRTIKRPTWENSKVIASNIAAEVARLRSAPGGDILVAGSGQLVRALAENNLVDEYRLMVFPIVLGTGKRLFGDTPQAASLQLAQTLPVGGGVVILIYRPFGNK